MLTPERVRHVESSTGSAPDVEAATKLANCHDFITKLPQGYDTVLGQNGRTLALTLVHPPVLALALALTLTLALALRP